MLRLPHSHTDRDRGRGRDWTMIYKYLTQVHVADKVLNAAGHFEMQS